MHFALSTLDSLIRPRLMVVAARHGLNDYNRAVLLPRLLELPMGRSLPAPQIVLAQLMARERAMEAARRHHDANWRAATHVAVMTALLFEARACACARAEPATGAAAP